jgi:dTDP-4-dehydrorhamnose 3,5-epimerase
VISAQADFQYKCTDFYMPDDERAIRWDDPELGIEWPLVSDAPPNVSARDAAAPLLRDAEVYEA